MIIFVIENDPCKKCICRYMCRNLCHSADWEVHGISPQKNIY